ncbi:MAG: hypothetical protein Q4C70_01020 [Planctomycetia bacterium]|nr:hypothetical protein [Planctomycetia bacterium]
MKKTYLVMLLILATLCYANLLSARTWTDKKGRVIEAEYNGLNSNGTKIELKTEDGQTKLVKFTSLSPKDQYFLREGKFFADLGQIIIESYRQTPDNRILYQESKKGIYKIATDKALWLEMQHMERINYGLGEKPFEITENIVVVKEFYKTIKRFAQENNVPQIQISYYEKQIQLLQLLEDCINEIADFRNTIDQRYAAMANSREFQKGFNGGYRGATAWDATNELTGDGDLALLAGLAVMVGSYLYESYEDEEEKKIFLENGINKIIGDMIIACEPIQKEAENLKSEVFTLYEYSIDDYKDSVEMNGHEDFPTARMFYEGMLSFSQSSSAEEIAKLNESEIDTLKTLVYAPIGIAASLPNLAHFDSERAELLYLAARSALVYNWNEDAKACCRMALDYHSDENGIIRECLMVTYMDSDLDKAYSIMEQIASLRHDSIPFLFMQTHLLSHFERYDEALVSLKKILPIYEGDITILRNEKVFEKLRNNRTEEFWEIFRPQFEWRPIIGWMYDEFCLTNKNSYTVTNVKMSVTLQDSEKTWNRDFTVEKIGPGETFKWDTSTTPDSTVRYPKKSWATITCDQDVP